MSCFSVIELLALAAARLAPAERALFEDLFDRGLTQDEAREERKQTPEQFAQTYRSMMRCLCGAIPAPAAAAAGDPQ